MNPSPYLALSRVECIVTYRCTGRCLHCQIGPQINRRGPAHLPVEQTIEALRTLADLFPLRSLMTFGGEPLLYAQATARLHKAATEAGIASRQVITNGYFTKDAIRRRHAAKALAGAGVNDLLLSVDAFHQQRIPLAPVRAFCQALVDEGVPVTLAPAWLVKEASENPYNAETRRILSTFDDLALPTGGNDIFLSGNAAKHLAAYYTPDSATVLAPCGSLPYTDPLTRVTSLSIEPGGAVTVCGFVLGNLLEEPVDVILARYDPLAHPWMRLLVEGDTKRLMKKAAAEGIEMDPARIHSVCDICHAITDHLYRR